MYYESVNLFYNGLMILNVEEIFVVEKFAIFLGLMVKVCCVTDVLMIE
jgi:hypothetical protein